MILDPATFPCPQIETQLNNERKKGGKELMWAGKRVRRVRENGQLGSGTYFDRDIEEPAREAGSHVTSMTPARPGNFAQSRQPIEEVSPGSSNVADA